MTKVDERKMKFSEITGNELRWVQTAKLESELVTPDQQVVARLVWKNSWGSMATGESALGNWTFKRAGFLRPKITIRKAETDESLGAVTMDFRGSGVLETSEGESYNFKMSRRNLTVLDSNQNQILTITPEDSDRKRIQAAVQVERKGDRPDKLAFLITLGWYMILLITQYDGSDSGYVAMITAVLVASA